MLTDRISLSGPEGTDAEDYLSSSLGVIFPDDITNQHGDAEHHIIYASPSFGAIQLALADPQGDDNRRLFSHFLWNAGVQLAALMEEGRDWDCEGRSGRGQREMWDVQGQRVLELGAGTGLAGIVAALKGAQEVVVTDYPAPEVVRNIRVNVEKNVKGRNCWVQGHEWGRVGTAADGKGDGEHERKTVGEEDAFTGENKESFGRILVADCLWMPWQHVNIMKSIRHFLLPNGRAWIVAGFHTGRVKMAGFYDKAVLAEQGLEIEYIWERDAEGKERDWVPDRGIEDVTERKRWLVIAVLKRIKADEPQ